MPLPSSESHSLGYSSSSYSFIPPDLTGQITKLDDQYCAAGGFGDVYRCQYHSESGAKEFMVEEEDINGRSNRMIRRELGIWKRLSHPNIVPFLGTVSGFGRLGNASLVSSWMPNGTLQDFLLKYDGKLTVAHRLQFMLGIANGLQYLHSLSIVHGDLTCTNVLLDEKHNARLTDFGYASLVGEIPDALAYLQASSLRPGAVRWAAPEYFFSNPEEMVHCTTKSDIYSFGNIALQVLSSELPWSEFQRDVVVVLHLAKGHKPRRPQSHPIDDQHWDFIEHCWSPVQERPSAEHLVSSILDFLRSYPHPQSFYGLLALSEKSNPQSTLSGPLLSPPNIEQFLPDIPRTFEILHPVTPNWQSNQSPTVGGLSSPRTPQCPPQLIPDSNWSTFPRKPRTCSGSEDGDGDEATSQAGRFRSTLEKHNQNGPAVNPGLSETDTVFPKRPPPAHSKSGAASPPFLNIGPDQFSIYPFPYSSSQQHSIHHHHLQGTTAFGRGDRGAASGSGDGRRGIWSYLSSRFSQSPPPARHCSPISEQPSVQLSNTNVPQFNFNPAYLTPGDSGAVNLRRVEFDSLSRSEDTTSSLAYPCSSSQEFINREFLYPQETVPSIRGHSHRASSGSHHGGGDGTWSPLSSNRPSPYPSPSVSPRVRYEDLPNIPLSGQPSSMLRPASSQPSPSNGRQITVCYETMTSERTAGASHRRRKQDTNFLCPVPGCGSTFTRSFHLKAHMKSHNKECPFQCKWPDCGMGFVRRRDWRRHEQLHSKYRPFTCEGCNKTFVRMDALNRHLRSEGGAECQRILDASKDKDKEGPLVPKTEEKGWPGMSVMV